MGLELWEEDQHRLSSAAGAIFRSSFSQQGQGQVVEVPGQVFQLWPEQLQVWQVVERA